MSRQSIILAACHFLDRADLSVSRRSVQEFLKLNLGKGYSSDEIAPIIAQFKKSGPLQDKAASATGPKTTVSEHELGQSQVSSRSTHAGVVKVLELEEPEATPQTLDLGLPLPVSQPVAKPTPAPRADRRSPAEQTADTALAGIRARVEPALSGMTWTAWKTQNRRATVDMARSGMSAEEIVEAQAEAFDHNTSTGMVMAWVQKRVVGRAAREHGTPTEQNASDAIPSASELRTPEEDEALRRKVAESRPAWFKPTMIEA